MLGKRVACLFAQYPDVITPIVLQSADDDGQLVSVSVYADMYNSEFAAMRRASLKRHQEYVLVLNVVCCAKLRCYLAM